MASATVAGIVLVGFAWYALSDEDAPSSGDDQVSYTCTPVSGFADVHGLAVAPDDVSKVYVATHHGLMRGTDDAGWCRLGDRQDDFMGFTMHPDDGSVFWVSGHPRSGGNMGVLQSTDGGYSWDFLALDGVDFHAMAVSPGDPDRLWGMFRGEVYQSDDGGHTWDVVSSAPPGMRGFAPHPEDPDVVFAATTAAVYRSDDGGESWDRHIELPTTALAIHPDDAAIMVAATAEGAVVKTSDGGESWNALPLQAQGIGHLTYARGDPDIVYAATYGGSLFKSTDAGETWGRVL